MSGLQVFQFGHVKVRTAGTADAPLFCAADVCDVLALGNVGQTLSRLDADEVESIITDDVQGKTRGISYVTESGLFSLILSSRKPEAKAFKKWVTSEVLPEIRKRGYYDALEVATRKQTELLLATCFPSAPTKAKPIFSSLISALLKMRGESPVGNPAWAPLLASLVYNWAIPIKGQQAKRRELNSSPNGSHVDHAMFSDDVRAHVLEVAQAGMALAKNSVSWDEWRARMDTAFNDAPLQLSLLTPVRRLPAPKRRKSGAA